MLKIGEMEYKSTIKTMPFLFLEIKKLSILALQGLTDAEIKRKAIEDNIFLVNTEHRKKEIASVLLTRLKTMDAILLSKLVNEDIETGKLIALYAIMKTDRLFLEFMNEVFREKLIIRDYRITDTDFNNFFIRKREQSEKIASWDVYTLYKLKQVYIRILFESGLIRNQKTREIGRPLVDQSLLDHLKSKNDYVILNILLGLN